MRKIQIALISTLVVFGVVCSLFIFLLSPTDKNKIIKNNSYVDFAEYLKSKSPDLLEYRSHQKQIIVSYSISEQDLSSILWSVYKSSSAPSNAALKIQSINTNIKEGRLTLYTNIKIYNTLPSQVLLEFSPNIDGNNLFLTLEKAQLGHIKLSNNFVIRKLKSYESSLLKVDTDKNQLVMENNFKDIAKISSIDLTEDSAKITALLPISSINDILRIMELDLFSNISDSIKNFLK